MIGWEIAAVLPWIEEHDQRTTVLATDLLTGSASVLRRDVDDDHGRWPALGQLGRRADHVDQAFLTKQGEQLGA